MANRRRPIPNQVGKIDFQEISLDHLHIRRRPGDERGGEIAIDLDGDDVAGALRQGQRQCAAAGSYFEERLVGRRGSRIDEPRYPGRFEEMLAESFSRARDRGQSSSSGEVSPRQYRSSISSICSSLIPK